MAEMPDIAKEMKLCLSHYGVTQVIGSQLILTSISTVLSSSMLWGTSCLGVAIAAGDTMEPGAGEMGGATEPDPVDHGEDDHTEFTNEPHTEIGLV
jgi:hypothetical protein